MNAKKKEIGKPEVNVKISVDGGEEFTPGSYILIFSDKVVEGKDGIEIYMIKRCELPNSVSSQEIGTYIQALNDLSTELSVELATRLAFSEEAVRNMNKKDMENKNAS